MKKTFKWIPALLVAFLSIAMFSCSDDDEDQPITYDQLPAMSKDFIKTYFSGEEIVSVTFDKDKNNKEYEVLLRNGFDLSFNTSGEWISVDGPLGATIPDGIAPQPIVNYVSTNYPNEGINEIEKVKTGYEVELTNGYELNFNQNGDFVSLDK